MKNKEKHYTSETLELRTFPYNKARALQLTYSACSDPHTSFCNQTGLAQNSENGSPIKVTESFSIGTQRTFVDSAYIGFRNGTALNTLLTVAWDKLLENRELHWSDKHPYERAKCLAGKLRKFLTREQRGLIPAYIWAREFVPVEGEHLHIGLHLPPEHRDAFLAFLERVLFERARDQPRPLPQRTKGEIACSVSGGWHLAVEVPDGKPQFSGYWIAAYLGKAEPSQRLFRGNLVDNELKPVRGKEFGGKSKNKKV